ncbi:hypothetical protein GTH44_39395 [Bradyrhizobium japonicum]|nr:hypothetical protein RN69_40035 [Bradyrhizobium japonicum]MYV87860.1 hypothetical protein [Bradyrhizobium japonicum]
MPAMVVPTRRIAIATWFAPSLACPDFQSGISDREAASWLPRSFDTSDQILSRIFERSALPLLLALYYDATFLALQQMTARASDTNFVAWFAVVTVDAARMAEFF